jgi:hypothetical protein
VDPILQKLGALNGATEFFTQSLEIVLKPLMPISKGTLLDLAIL